MMALVGRIKLPGTNACRSWAVAFLLAISGSLALCQSSDQQRTRDCKRYETVEIPSADLPTAQDREALATCAARVDTGAIPAPSVDLYFGIAHPADPVKARKCAYLEREGNKKTGEGGISVGDLGGAGLLAMIYANGKGAARSFDLALKFACECDDEQGEGGKDSRFNHLLELEKQHWTGKDFSLCDDIKNSYSDGALACRYLRQHFEQVAYDTRLGKVEANWSSKEKEAFKDLQRAAQAFFQASSENEVEVPMRGAGAAYDAEIRQIDARAELNEVFIAGLEKFEQGQLPRFSAAEFKKSDAELNSIYKLRVQPLDPDPDAAPDSITPEGIRTAQRAWLRYREAWVAFGQVRYPSVTADSWRTWVTQQRVERWKNGE